MLSSSETAEPSAEARRLSIGCQYYGAVPAAAKQLADRITVILASALAAQDAEVAELSGTYNSLRQVKDEYIRRTDIAEAALAEARRDAEMTADHIAALEAEVAEAAKALARLGLARHAATWITREEADRISKDGP